MKYRYETHVHSDEGSICGATPIREMVRAFHERGYAGFVLTDHFIHGNTAVPRDLPWAERMKRYYDIFLQAKEEGDKLDFDVFFGVEHHYEMAREVLIYGIDLDFLLAHPELETADLETYAKLVHEAGGLLFHAHPYRKREYIPEGYEYRMDLCDGIEVYNAGDPWDTNQAALQDALTYDKLQISGGDVHSTGFRLFGQSGIACDERIRTADRLIEILRSGKYELIRGTL